LIVLVVRYVRILRLSFAPHTDEMDSVVHKVNWKRFLYSLYTMPYMPKTPYSNTLLFSLFFGPQYLLVCFVAQRCSSSLRTTKPIPDFIFLSNNSLR